MQLPRSFARLLIATALLALLGFKVAGIDKSITNGFIIGFLVFAVDLYIIVVAAQRLIFREGASGKLGGGVLLLAAAKFFILALGIYFAIVVLKVSPFYFFLGALLALVVTIFFGVRMVRPQRT